MAQDKIINKILEDARTQANRIIEDAHQKAEEEETRINNQTEQRLKELQTEFKTDSKELERRAQLNANLQERKDLLSIKQDVMNQAFDLAKKDIKNLQIDEWRKLITQIVLDGTITDTEYIKVPEKDLEKYTKKDSRGKTFLNYLNSVLKENGHLTPLEIDKNPAHFSDGLMLIGKYSDVNASFDVLIDNMKESLEWNVAQILFKK